jgi:hypothetical protein
LFRNFIQGQSSNDDTASNTIPATTDDIKTNVRESRNGRALDLKQELKEMMQSESESIRTRINVIEDKLDEKERQQISVFDLQSDIETVPDLMSAMKDLRTKMLLSARGEKNEYIMLTRC